MCVYLFEAVIDGIRWFFRVAYRTICELNIKQILFLSHPFFNGFSNGKMNFSLVRNVFVSMLRIQNDYFNVVAWNQGQSSIISVFEWQRSHLLWLKSRNVKRWARHFSNKFAFHDTNDFKNSAFIFYRHGNSFLKKEDLKLNRKKRKILGTRRKR